MLIAGRQISVGVHTSQRARRLLHATHRGKNPISRRNFPGIEKLESHPRLPLAAPAAEHGHTIPVARSSLAVRIRPRLSQRSWGIPERRPPADKRAKRPKPLSALSRERFSHHGNDNLS